MNYTALPDAQAATVITEALQDFDRQHERRYAAIGLAALECERRELWRHVQDSEDGFPCRSFARWIKVCCPHSASTVYAALADVKELSDLPAESVAWIRESNFDTMKSLSTTVRRDPNVLKAASQGSTADLVDYVQRNHPLQAVERVTVMKLTLTVFEKEVVDEAIKKAKARGDASMPGECVSGWAAAYLADCILEEGYRGNATGVIQ